MYAMCNINKNKNYSNYLVYSINPESQGSLTFSAIIKTFHAEYRKEFLKVENVATNFAEPSPGSKS